MSIILQSKDSLKELLAAIRQPVVSDLKDLDAFILRELHSDIPLIQAVTQHIMSAGGKRLRPLVVILCARAAGYCGDVEHLELATIIEFVHTATLLHDDVIDGSMMRRGNDTANAMYGNQASVLVGDFLYSRSFQILTRRSRVPIMQVLANTTNAIAEGEVIQLMNCNNPNTSEKAYYDIIERKTAKLFESACEIGAMLNTQDHTVYQAAATYGSNLGLAFQLIDDVLDYSSSSEAMGKNSGDDLGEGKPTLPLIYTMQHSDEDMRRKIYLSIEQGTKQYMDDIVEAMHRCQAFDYCFNKANQHLLCAKQALDSFEQSPYRDALQQLLDFVIRRDY